MTRRTRYLLLLALPLAMAAVTATALADPPSWAPAHGYRAKHRYVYYPRAEVYYAPERHMWFWMGGNGWQAGVSLPGDLRAYVSGGGVDIELGVDQPYLRHTEIVDEYGGHLRRHREYRERRDRREYRRDYRDEDRDDDRGRGRGRGHGHGRGRG